MYFKKIEKKSLSLVAKKWYPNCEYALTSQSDLPHLVWVYISENVQNIKSKIHPNQTSVKMSHLDFTKWYMDYKTVVWSPFSLKGIITKTHQLFQRFHSSVVWKDKGCIQYSPMIQKVGICLQQLCDTCMQGFQWAMVLNTNTSILWIAWRCSIMPISKWHTWELIWKHGPSN